MIILCVITFIGKVVFSIVNGFYGVDAEDWNIATNLVNGYGFSEIPSVGPTAYKLPAYPIFAAAFIQIFGSNAKIFVIIFQHLIYSFLPFMFIEIFKQLGKDKTAYMASWLFLFSPAYFYYSNVIEATNLFIPIFALWIFQAIRVYKSKRTKIEFSILALFTALVALTQAIAVPVMLAYFILLFRKIKAKEFAFIVILAAMLYSPWVIRNFMVYDTIVLSKSPVWNNIYIGYLPDCQYFESLKLVPEQVYVRNDSLRTCTRDIAMEPEYRKSVEDINKTHPYIFIKKWAANLLYLWYAPPKYLADSSLIILITRKIYVIVLFIFTVLGIWRLSRDYRKAALLLILAFALFSLPYMISQAVNIRYKLDFEWMQFFVVAYYFQRIMEKFHK